MATDSGAADMETIRDPQATNPRPYIVRFFGRKAGALGIEYWIDAEVYADNPDAARVALYQKYEHITHFTATEPQS